MSVATSLLSDVAVLHFEIAMQGVGGGGLRQTSILSHTPEPASQVGRYMSYILYIYIYEETGNDYSCIDHMLILQ